MDGQSINHYVKTNESKMHWMRRTDADISTDQKSNEADGLGQADETNEAVYQSYY